MTRIIGCLTIICVALFIYSGTTKTDTIEDSTRAKMVYGYRMPDSSAKKLQQTRAEVFKEMGWVEGKYRSKKEESISKKMRGDYLYHPEMMNLGNVDSNFVRPFIEIIFNPNVAVEDRSAAIGKFEYLAGKKAIPILKSLLDVEDVEIQKSAAHALYDQGDKKTAFEKMVELAKKGANSAFSITKNHKWYYDPFSKPYFEQIATFDNNPEMQCFAAYNLAELGDTSTAMFVVDKIDNKKRLGSLQLDGNSFLERYYLLTKKALKQVK